MRPGGGEVTNILIEEADAGEVTAYPPDSPPYVMVSLTRGFEDRQEADAVAARIARVIYDAHVEAHGAPE